VKNDKKNIIIGRNPVLEWLDAGLKIQRIYLSNEAGHKPIQDILRQADKKRIDVRRVNRFKLEQISGTDKHQNIVAEVTLPEYAEIDDIFAAADKRNQAPLVAILDGIQDPHNLGAVLRSADAAGVHGIIIPKDKAVGITPTVVKSSAGAAAWVPVALVTNLARSMDELKNRGVWITGTDQDGDRLYDEHDYKGPTAIVLGSEGKGMKRLVRERCDFLVQIPMAGHVTSLNVSVAAGLLFFQAQGQRMKKGMK